MFSYRPIISVSPYQVTKNTTALKRVVEMKEVLCTLGQEIPWLRSEVTVDNVVQQVEDILQFRNALLRRAMMSHEEALLAETSSSVEEPPVGSQTDTAPSTTPLASSGQADRTSAHACQTLCAANAQETHQQGARDQTSTELKQQAGPDDPDDPDSQALAEPNWGKRVLFAPPCVRNAKVRRVDRGQWKEVTGDEEISDSEIESYLRTPQEVRLFAATQRALSDGEEEA